MFYYLFKDRLLWFWAILRYWHYTTVIYFTSKCTHMCHILIKRQIIGLSNDIDNIKMGKRILLNTMALAFEKHDL